MKSKCRGGDSFSRIPVVPVSTVACPCSGARALGLAAAAEGQHKDRAGARPAAWVALGLRR